MGLGAATTAGRITINETDPGIDLDNFFLNDEIEKYSGLKPQGWNILVRLYTEPQLSAGGIFKPYMVQEEQEFKNCVGLVVKKSKAAYQDGRYEQTGQWCEEGDWVAFPRHAGYKIKYKGVPLFVLKEDAIDLIIDDPRTISR